MGVPDHDASPQGHESATRIIKAQGEQTETLLGAILKSERTPEDEFSTYTAKAMLMIRDKLSLVEISLPRFEIARIEEQWELGKPVLLSGQSGTGKSGIAKALARESIKPVLLLDARDVSHLNDEPSLRHHFNLTAPLGETIINLARDKGFRLVIDQFDNLIDKIRAANQITRLALECAESKVVEVIVISRNKEANEGRLLRPLIQAGFFSIESHEIPEGVVIDVLKRLGIDSPTLELVQLGQNLLNLEIVCMVRQQWSNFDFLTTSSETALWEQFIQILQDRESAANGIDHAELIIARAAVLARISLQASDLTFRLEATISPVERSLISCGIIVHKEGRFYRFGHEKLQDYLYARSMCDQGSMPNDVGVEIGSQLMRNILPFMESVYSSRKSDFLPQFLQEVFFNVK
jgi:hypothetical protein